MITCTKINIIIPAFNEETYIEKLFEEIVLETASLKQDIFIYVIDDGSTDSTLLELEKVKVKHNNSNIIILKNKKNKGKGYSINKALKSIANGIIIIQDADLEYSPKDYKKVLSPILENKADVVYGSRFRGDQPKRVLYYTHYLANRFLTILSNIFTGLNLTDMETCFKAFKQETVSKIELLESGFGFEPEITAKLSRIKDIRFYEVGIAYYGRTYKEGKKIKFKDAVRTLFCIIKYNL